MYVKIAGSLCQCHRALINQSYRLKLELAAELPSLHRCSPFDEKTLSRCPSNLQQLTCGLLLMASALVSDHDLGEAIMMIGGVRLSPTRTW